MFSAWILAFNLIEHLWKLIKLVNVMMLAAEELQQLRTTTTTLGPPTFYSVTIFFPPCCIDHTEGSWRKLSLARFVCAPIVAPSTAWHILLARSEAALSLGNWWSRHIGPTPPVSQTPSPCGPASTHSKHVISCIPWTGGVKFCFLNVYTILRRIFIPLNWILKLLRGELFK